MSPIYTYTNRLKGLDLIDRLSEELWIQVHGIVQETGSKTIPKKKKCNSPPQKKNPKKLSEEALQIAEKRREVKGIFKGLNLIECLMNYGQRFMTLYSNRAQDHLQEKKRKKTKCLSEKALLVLLLHHFSLVLLCATP